MSLALQKYREPIDLMYIDIFEKDKEDTSPERYVILPYINSMEIFKGTKYITKIDISTQKKFFITLFTTDNKIVHYKKNIVFEQAKPFINGFIRNMEFETVKYTNIYGTVHRRAKDKTITMIEDKLEFGVETPMDKPHNQYSEDILPSPIDCIRKIDYNEYNDTMMRYIRLLNNYTNVCESNILLIPHLQQEISTKDSLFNINFDLLDELTRHFKRLADISGKNYNYMLIYGGLCFIFIWGLFNIHKP